MFSRSEKGPIVPLHKGIAPADSVSVSTKICWAGGHMYKIDAYNTI
jgi:hypothetical protein